MDALKNKLISHINRKAWWHVPPADPKAYKDRGKFYASSFREAEFWGRPLDVPERVTIANPIVGDEQAVQLVLFGRRVRFPGDDARHLLEWRWKLDARMKQAALRKGFDAIVIFSPAGFANYRRGRIPRSVELNVL